MTRKRVYLVTGATILIVAILLINGFSLAKYASDSVWNYYLKSKGFYFTSEDLSADGITNVNNVWTGESTYFNIKNSANNSLVSEFDINYTASCSIKTEGITGNCVMNGSGSSTYNGVLSSYQKCTNNTSDGVDTSGFTKAECDIGGYDFENDENVSELYFDITDLSSDVTDLTVTVTVSTTSPYQKTIKGDFVLHVVPGDDEVISYNVKELSDNYAVVITNAYTVSKCLTLSWDNSVANINAESTNFNSYQTDSNGEVNSINFTISGKNSIIYNFINKTDSTLTKDNFSLMESDSCN